MDPDPFDQLGVAAAFDLDEAALQRAFLARAAALHPDLGASSAAADHDAHSPADEAALARLNEARAALADPERRANALLDRLGGPSREQDRTLPPDFLTEMMQVQESIQQARDAGDGLDPWRRWADRRRLALMAEVGGLFRDLPDPPPAESLAAIRLRLNQWRYIERIAEQLAQ